MGTGQQAPLAGNRARTGLIEHTEQPAGQTRPEEQPRAAKPLQAGEPEWRIADTARTAAWAVPETGAAATPAAAGRTKPRERPAGTPHRPAESQRRPSGPRSRPAWFQPRPAWFPAQPAWFRYQRAEFRRQRVGLPSQPVRSPAEDRCSAPSPGFREPRYSADSPSRQTIRWKLLLDHPVQVGPQHLHVRPPNLQVAPRPLHVRPKTLQVHPQTTQVHAPTVQVHPEPPRPCPRFLLIPEAVPIPLAIPAPPASPARLPARGFRTATAASHPIVPVVPARIVASADSHPPADALHSYSWCQPMPRS
ncbi:hypothetical protein BSTEL_0823 [Bifidobacterium stellenboschense]|uniref:Uncharacterized protein n=1 Tax=Bifidobacterium stellenboschense TaxID=762211 RepID=A0A087DRB3_9BIFI|nr:hypothetical protein BSTEL_0823 [Bifidobacterium stellenboschense]